MWIQNAKTKQIIDVDKLSQIHTGESSGTATDKYYVCFTSIDMGHSTTWRFNTEEELNNVMVYIKWLLKPAVIDAKVAPLHLE